MIIGNGLLAKAFAEVRCDPEVAIFASGVSNSQEVRTSEFARERALLEDALNDAGRLVYFSSCGVADDAGTATAYMRHKRQMEALVSGGSRNMVLRLPQVVGRTGNPHTLTNFLCDRIKSGSPFAIWANAERNLVDIDDVVAITARLLAADAASVPPLAAVAADRSLPMPELVGIFERILGTRSRHVLEPRGSPMTIHPRLPKRLIEGLDIDLGESYAERVLRKYYGAAADVR